MADHASLARDGYMAELAALQMEAAGMTAENAQRASVGAAPAYVYGDFYHLAQRAQTLSQYLFNLKDSL